MFALESTFKEKVVAAIRERMQQRDMSAQQLARTFKTSGSQLSRLLKGQLDHVISDSKWIEIARELGVGIHEREWKIARTAVFTQIEEDVMFCQQNAKAMIFVDECGIGKTFTAKYLAKALRNCFFIDASQAKTRNQFNRLLAKAVGMDESGRYSDIKDNIKFYLRNIPSPVIIVDEAGDLDYAAFLELKEYWNATEGACGWYLMGADGLRAKIQKGIQNQKVGYREIFSRFSSNYSHAVPQGKPEKVAFYQDLFRTVLEANTADKHNINKIVNKCMAGAIDQNIGGLRRLESLLILHQQNDEQA
ncbi:MAG TPA: AAA family ATPase [Mucilaginibacter sp.]|nr:AAA family ATPase [Mucilaginibacter sp.]